MDLGGTPLPPFTDFFFSEKGVTDLGGTPAPPPLRTKSAKEYLTPSLTAQGTFPAATLKLCCVGVALVVELWPHSVLPSFGGLLGRVFISHFGSRWKRRYLRLGDLK